MQATTAQAKATITHKEALGKGQSYEDPEIAVLQGWCGVAETHAIPRIYGRFSATKNKTTHRMDLSARMKKWSTDFGYEINKIYLTNQALEDLVKLNAGHMEAVPHFKTCERGVSIMNCLRRSKEELTEAQRRDKAADDSAGTRGFAEALDLSSSDPRPPPDTLDKFKKAVATLAAKLWALFSEECALYKDVLTLRETLDLDEVGELEDDGHYTPAKIRQYVWAVKYYTRTYFNQTRTPEYFAGRGPFTFPVSRLNLILAEVSSAQPIILPNFPSKWMTTRWGRGGGENTGSQPQEWALKPPGGTWGSPPGNWGPLGGGTGGGGGDRGGGEYSHLNGHIKNFMKDYNAKFHGRVALKKICEAANVNMEALPYLQKYVTGERNDLCYNHVLGICGFHKAGRCQFKHAPKNEIKDDFGGALCKIIKPGVEWMIKNGEPGKRHHEGGDKKRLKGGF